MSVTVMSLVWANPPVGGSELLVLLALADNADDERRLAWPSISTLARKTRMSERSVQRALRALVADGILAIKRPGGGRQQPTVYEVFPKGCQIVTGDTGGTETVTLVSPEPSIEPSLESSPNGSDTQTARASEFPLRLLAPDPVTAAVCEVLGAVVADRPRAKPLDPEAVRRTIAAYPDRDHVAEAHDMTFWLTTTTKGKRKGAAGERRSADFARTYRNWLDNAVPARDRSSRRAPPDEARREREERQARRRAVLDELMEGIQ